MGTALYSCLNNTSLIFLCRIKEFSSRLAFLHKCFPLTDRKQNTIFLITLTWWFLSCKAISPNTVVQDSYIIFQLQFLSSFLIPTLKLQAEILMLRLCQKHFNTECDILCLLCYFPSILVCQVGLICETKLPRSLMPLPLKSKQK